MLTKADKALLLTALNMVDVKKLNLNMPENHETKVSPEKWFRFGSYNGLMIAQEIIKGMPEKKTPVKKIKIT